MPYQIIDVRVRDKGTDGRERLAAAGIDASVGSVGDSYDALA